MKTEHKKQQQKHSSSTKPECIANGRNIQQQHNLNSSSNIRDTIKNWQSTQQISIAYSKADPPEPQGTIKQAAFVCSPTDDDEFVHTVTEHTDHPVDDFIAVKTPDFHIRDDQVQELEELNSSGTLTSVNHQLLDMVTVKEYQGFIRAVHPLKNESDSTMKCQEIVPAKKEFDGDDPDYNDDEYLHIVRGITSVPHDFAPERVVTPVYTVPRYPDNHNPLLPLSLQKKLGKSNHRH